MNLYNRIEQLCSAHGMNVTDMCKYSGASRGSLGDLKSGKKKALSIETLYKISKYFGITIDELVASGDARIFESRRYKRLEPQFLAEQLGISIYTYNYYEDNKQAPENILKKLSTILDVDYKFICGIPYTLKNPIFSWDRAKQEDYNSAPEYDRIIMEYMYGDIQYIESSSSHNFSKKETVVIISYRNKPEMQPAVDKLLGIDTDASSASNIAADVAEEAKDFITSQQITSIKQN